MNSAKGYSPFFFLGSPTLQNERWDTKAYPIPSMEITSL